MENFIYCTEEEIVSYLNQFGEGRDRRDTELSEAVRFKRLYEKEFRKPFLIGIPVAEEALRQLRIAAITKNEAIKNFRKDSTDIDFLIIDAADFNAGPRDSFSGDAYQMKRITDHQYNGDFTTTILQELQKIFKKGYTQSTYLNLYLPLNLAPQAHTPDWKALAKFCSEQKVPFAHITLGPVKNEQGEELLIDIHPKLRTVLL